MEKHIALIDHVGRTIIGKVVSSSAETITVNNPVILHCQPQQNGQLEVQTFPLFFFEFIDKGFKEQNNWTYTRSNIVESDVVLDERILSQYGKINTPLVEEPKTSSPKVISINDL